MYITVGSSPNLHFVPLTALVQGLEVEDQQNLDAYVFMFMLYWSILLYRYTVVIMFHVEWCIRKS